MAEMVTFAWFRRHPHTNPPDDPSRSQQMRTVMVGLNTALRQLNAVVDPLLPPNSGYPHPGDKDRS